MEHTSIYADRVVHPDISVVVNTLTAGGHILEKAARNPGYLLLHTSRYDEFGTTLKYCFLISEGRLTEEQMTKSKPLQTASGQIELYSNYIGNKANRGKGEHVDPSGQVYEHLPSDWGELAPMAVYRTAIRGMDDPLVRKYPLMLLSPHPRYRSHSTFWNHPWLRDHIYHHRVWISPADA